MALLPDSYSNRLKEVSIIIKNIEEAIRIIKENCSGSPGYLLAELNDHYNFSDEMFWALYDSIMLLVKEKYYDNDLINNVSYCYQRLLKEFIYHLSANDSSDINNFPEEYNGYLQRMDYVIQALYSKCDISLGEDDFELQRNV